MFERSSKGNNPGLRRSTEDAILAIQDLGWDAFQALTGKQAREGRYVLEVAAAMCNRRHGISLEQSHNKGKTKADV